MSILIVDDNRVSAKIMELNLQKSGYETIVARSGREALQHMADRPGIELIIADILMPEMDGLELIQKIYERPEWSGTPSIMCSSIRDAETIKKAVKLGCRRYILKPVSKTQLIEKVKETIGTNKRVLRQRERIVEELGIDPDSYDAILAEFSLQVNELIPLLEGSNKEGFSRALCLKLTNVSEGASQIGAERIDAVFEKHAHIHDGRVDCANQKVWLPALLRELRLLHEHLLADGRPGPA
jgi:CheY-like chemotaxis protein